MLNMLTIVADDYGIGPETSRGILDLARSGVITATVMIVNCPDAPRAAEEWRRERPEADLGWHPNLTLDRPVADPKSVRSLVDSEGLFHPLPEFMKRTAMGAVSEEDVFREWSAQYRRFEELTGFRPPVINSHQHVSLFPPADRALMRVIADQLPRPYIRRVVERADMLMRIGGARLKRTFLTILGRRNARRTAASGYPGCDWLVGVTDHHCVADEAFWSRRFDRLRAVGTVEVCCHPGYTDPTLIGRDCAPSDRDGLLRRPRETELLTSERFRVAYSSAGLLAVRPSLVGRPKHSDRIKGA